MKIVRGKGATFVAQDISNKELYNILKVQINIKLVFTNDGNEIGFIYLLKRLTENGEQKITVSEYKNASRPKVITYNELLVILKQNLALGLPSMVFESNYFKKKLPLIEIIGDIKPQLIAGCVSIDYSDGMFSVISKEINRKPNELYYWEDTNNLYVFSEKGPNLNYNSKYTSIEQIIC